MIPLPRYGEQKAPMKPRFGETCNGCGYCCAAEVCEVGHVLFGKDCPAPCPGMQFRDGRFLCHAVELADGIGAEYGAYLRLRMGVGRGCDSDDTEGIEKLRRAS